MTTKTVDLFIKLSNLNYLFINDLKNRFWEGIAFKPVIFELQTFLISFTALRRKVAMTVPSNWNQDHEILAILLRV